MRLLDTLALATSAVMAFNQPRQDSPVLLDHQQVQMGAEDNDLRTLLACFHVVSRARVVRVPACVLESRVLEARALQARGLQGGILQACVLQPRVLAAQLSLKVRVRGARVLEAQVEAQVMEVTYRSCHRPVDSSDNLLMAQLAWEAVVGGDIQVRVAVTQVKPTWELQALGCTRHVNRIRFFINLDALSFFLSFRDIEQRAFRHVSSSSRVILVVLYKSCLQNSS
ncbi:hypothetical protein Ae201684_017908 [Aphanomyces euteiches]|uniref:Uncharacterized protein n=1 Tax=Aphanomyces euteiches TaxID=100861 RepID=A0A6G0WA29_9STRA|nr:hypothetical protein Ae201684_017908 [Aphanomyces euteiches]